MSNTTNASSQAQFKTKIEQLIRAGYALVHVRSHEEIRTLQNIKEVCDKMKQIMYVWDSQGNISVFDDNTHSLKKESAAETLFPKFMSEEFRERTALAVLDFHFFVGDNPAVIRSIKNSLNILRRDGKIVIFVGPRLALPEELEKDVTVIEFPLPNREELGKTLTYVINSANEQSAKKLDCKADTQEKLYEGALGLTSSEAEDLFSLALSKNHKMDSEAVKIILDGKCQILKKDGTLEYIDLHEAMNDVGGLDILKSWLLKRRRAFSTEARDFGLPNPKGILLVGIAGCGKSLTAKAAASNWEIPLIRLDVGRIFNKFQGESESSARKVIQMAETMAPCILWIDEIEKGLAGVKSSGDTDSGVTARVVGTFLTWMQEKTSPVFVVATANDVTKLPPELLRKGRFDEIFFVDLPNAKEREEIIKIQLRKRNRNLKDISEIVKESEQYTGAEIEQAILAGLYECFEEGKRDLIPQDVIKALKQFIPLATTMKEQIMYLRDWGATRARLASSQKAPEISQAAPFLRKIQRNDSEPAKEPAKEPEAVK